MSSSGPEFVECARLGGLFLDDWQAYSLERGLGEQPNGNWASLEVAECVGRQNGKGSIIEALELGWLFVTEERLVIHSAHQFDTSLEAFRRLLYLIENTPDFDRQVQRVSRAHGEEGIELKKGRRIRFRTRTKGGGRGFTGDKVVFDEAMYISEAMHSALFPVVSARPNPQFWYFGSAVDQLTHQDGIVFARLRERGRAGGDPSLTYLEWSIDRSTPDDVTDFDAVNEQHWAQANPALGIRISLDYLRSEQRALSLRGFAVERLGVGDWPRTDGLGEVVIALDDWLGLWDEQSAIESRPCFAFAVSMDRAMASIGVAGKRPDGQFHVEVIDRRAGTGWLANRCAELKKHDPVGFVCAAGPAASLIPEMEQAGVTVETLNTPEYAQACGMFYDAVDQQQMRHLNQPELASAIRGAVKAPVGDAWKWSRKNSSVDITPLEAITVGFSKIAFVPGPWDEPPVMFA